MLARDFNIIENKKESGPSGHADLLARGKKTFVPDVIEVIITPPKDSLVYQTIGSVEYEIKDEKNIEKARAKALKIFNTNQINSGLITKKQKFTADQVDIQSRVLSLTSPQKIVKNLYNSEVVNGVNTLENIADKDQTNIANILQAVKTADDSRGAVFTNILENFITHPGAKNFPVTVLDDITLLTKTYGFERAGDIINDFAEVMAPVGLLTNNLNGNGQRLITEFLGARNIQDLMRNATIHFQPERNFPLVDSYIEYRGRVVSISSKSNGGAAAKFKGLANSIKEIESNPTSKRLFAELLKDKRIRQAYKVIEILANSQDQEEEQSSSSSTIKQNKQVQITISGNQGSMIDKITVNRDLIRAIGIDNIAITDNDYNKFVKFIQANNIKNSADWTVEKSRLFRQLIQNGEFTDKFKNIFVYYRSPRNELGRGFRAGEMTDERDIFTLFRQGCASHINAALNADQVYSDLATWIFNHSAIIQVNFSTSPAYDYVTKKQDYDYVGRGYITKKTNGTVPLVFYNMIATWPATGVDNVRFAAGGSEDQVYNKLLAGDHDAYYPVKDQYETSTSATKDILNRTDPIVEIIISRQKLDRSKPGDQAKIRAIENRISELRANTSQDLARSPEDWADLNIFQSNPSNIPLAKTVAGKRSTSAEFILPKYVATRLAAQGYTDAEIVQKFKNGQIDVGDSIDRVENIVQAVKQARKQILNFVLYRTTDKKIKQEYNDLVQNDLLGRDNPYKTPIFYSTQTNENYDRTSSHRATYNDMHTGRTDTLIIRGIRNFERIRQTQPTRFAQLLRDSNIDPDTVDIDIITTAKNDKNNNNIIGRPQAKAQLNKILQDRAVGQMYLRNIPEQERFYVYDELIDYIATGASRQQVIAAIENWKQNELVAENSNNNTDIKNTAAGCLIMAQDTGRICLGLRNAYVDQPGVWSTFGGHVKDSETPGQAARRECWEETGLHPAKIQKLAHDQAKNGLDYTTYLTLVPHEFTPKLNHEHTESAWYDLENIPDNVHPGLKQTLDNLNNYLVRVRQRAQSKS